MSNYWLFCIQTHCNLSRENPDASKNQFLSPPPLISRNIFVREIAFFFPSRNCWRLKARETTSIFMMITWLFKWKLARIKNDFMFRSYVSRWHCTFFYRRLIKILLHFNEILSLIWYFSSLQFKKKTLTGCAHVQGTTPKITGGRIQPANILEYKARVNHCINKQMYQYNPDFHCFCLIAQYVLNGRLSPHCTSANTLLALPRVF